MKKDKIGGNDAISLDAYIQLQTVARMCNRLKIPVNLYFILEMVKRLEAAGQNAYLYAIHVGLNLNEKVHTVEYIDKLVKSGYLSAKPGVTDVHKRPTTFYYITVSGLQITDAVNKNVDRYLKICKAKRNRLALGGKMARMTKEEMDSYVKTEFKIKY